MRVLTTVKLAAVSAAKKLIAVISANVWLVAAAAVAGLVYALYKFSSANNEAARRQAETNEAFGVAAAAASKEENKLKSLFDALNKAKQGTAAYARAKNSIMEQYGEYIRQIEAEHGKIKKLSDVYELLREKVVAAARARAMEAYVDKKMGETAEERGELVSNIRGVLSKKFHGAFLDHMVQKTLKAIRDGNLSERYIKQFDELQTIAQPGGPSTTQVYNPLRVYAAGMKKLDQRDAQVQADAKAVLSADKSTGNAGANGDPVKNKTYWDNKKKDAQEQLERLDTSKAADRKAAAVLRKQIAGYDKQLEFFSAGSHGGGKSGGGKGGHKVDPKKEEENRQKNEALDAHALTQAQDKEQAAEIKAARERYAVLTQAEIDAKKEGAEKERAQNALDLQKELDQIDEQTAALLEAKRDQAEAVWNATHRKERDKGLRFNRSSITAANFSKEEADYFAKLEEYARARRAAKDDATAEKYNRN